MGVLYSRKLVTLLFLLIRTIPPIIGSTTSTTTSDTIMISDTTTIRNSDDAITINAQNSSTSSEFNTSIFLTSTEINDINVTAITPAKNETEADSKLESLQTDDTGKNVSDSTISVDETVLEPKSSSEMELPPNPPQKLQQSPLSSLLQGGTSSESLQQFLKSRGFSFSPGEPPPDPVELNELLSRLKPKQGRFDPALLDIINNVNAESGGFIPNIPTIFGNLVKNRNLNDKKLMEEESIKNTNIYNDNDDATNYWAPSLPPKSKPANRIRNRFSSKFLHSGRNISTTTTTTTTQPPPETGPRPATVVEQGGFFPSSISLQPFSHITDPNLRNHRLYDWELEKNFTSIDQLEDLLADSSEADEVMVKVPPPPGWKQKPSPPSQSQSRDRHKNYFSSSIRPVSMEGTQFDSSGDLNDGNSIPANKFVPLPQGESSGGGSSSDDDSDEPFNLLRPKRPREPLRESSTENLVFSSHGLSDSNGGFTKASISRSSTVDRRRLVDSDGGGDVDNNGSSDEMQGQSSTFNTLRSQQEQQQMSEGRRKLQFRPSPTDDRAVALSPPVFVDPDQDFFTSTIRNYNKMDDNNDDRDPPSFIRPMRNRHSKQRTRHSKVNNKQNSGNRRTEKRKRRPISEEAITDLDRDPRPYPPDNDDDRRDHRDRPTPFPQSHEQQDQNDDDNDPRNPLYLNSNPTRKSDRILVHPGGRDHFIPSSDLNQNSQSEVRPSYYNFYPVREFGPASNEHENDQYPAASPSNDDHHPYGDYGSNNNNNNPPYYNPSKSGQGVVLGHNGEQIYTGGYDDKFHNPFASADSQPEYSSYSPTSNEGWLNTYWILGGLIALSALTAFVLPTLLNSMGRHGKNKIRNDLQDENFEYTDDQTSPASTSSSSTLTSSLFGGGNNKRKPKPPSEISDYGDPTEDSDLWTEIKGVYNDVVKIVKGDYGGIVDKLSGGLNKNNKDKDKIGPNIVYRDDDVIDDDHKDDDLLEADFLDYDTTKYKNKNKNKKTKFGNRKGKAKPKGSNKKNRNIASSINYIVSNSSPGSVVAVKSKNGLGVGVDEQETSRGVVINDTMATFHPNFFSSSSRPFSLFPSSPSVPPSSSHPGDSFMGEWAKVQLIGS